VLQQVLGKVRMDAEELRQRAHLCPKCRKSKASERLKIAMVH
jgi:hypothetical protein